MLTFEIATPAARAEVEDILRRSYGRLLAVAYPQELITRVIPVVSRAQDDLLGSGSYVLARVADGALAAVGGWTLDAPGRGPRTPGLAHIRHVATDPDRGRQGIGRALIAYLVSDASARGGARQVEALATRNAERFYAACGFRRIDEVDVPLGPGIALPSVRMRTPA